MAPYLWFEEAYPLRCLSNEIDGSKYEPPVGLASSAFYVLVPQPFLQSISNRARTLFAQWTRNK